MFVAAEAVNRTKEFVSGHRLVTALGATCLIAAASGAANATFNTSSSAEAEAGTAEVTRTFIHDTPDECHGGYEVQVNGAKVEVKKDIRLFPDARLSEEFNGKITAEVCNANDPEKAGYWREITDSPNGREIKIEYTSEAFTTKVYQTDPLDPKAFTPDNNIVAGAAEAFGSIIKSIPVGVEMTGSDEMRNWTRGMVLMQAYANVTDGCGSTAWELLEPLYEEALIKKAISDNNEHAPGTDFDVTAEDITIELPTPEEIQFTTQYDEQLKDIQGALEENSVKLTSAEIDKVSDCKPSDNLKAGV